MFEPKAAWIGYQFWIQNVWGFPWKKSFPIFQDIIEVAVAVKGAVAVVSVIEVGFIHDFCDTKLYSHSWIKAKWFEKV